MQTETQIRETIKTLRAAIEKDGFKPVVDGKNLAEHLYYIRLGGIQHLEDVIRTQEEIDRAEDEIDQCPFCGCGCPHAQSGDKCATCNESP